MLKLNTSHFLTGEELSQAELSGLINTACELKKDRKASILSGKSVALVFDKPSLRTRMSFAVAIQDLGGHVLEVNAGERKKESPQDSVRVLQGYVDGLMVRTFAHDNLTTMIKHARIPVINGLSDLHHPCQALADLQTLQERFGQLRGLTVTYLGDGNNVLHSLLLLLPFVGVNVNYACPPGFLPDPDILQRAQARAEVGQATIKAFTSPKDACAGADALYTDVWTSMGSEAEEQNRLKHFEGYQLNAELLNLAKPHALIMHCMPINIDQEITAEMVEHKNSALFSQSENRLHAQKALLVGLYAKFN